VEGRRQESKRMIVKLNHVIQTNVLTTGTNQTGGEHFKIALQYKDIYIILQGSLSYFEAF